MVGGGRSRHRALNRRLRDAASAGDTDLVTELIRDGAEVDDSDGYGKTALMRAAAGGHMATVTTLVRDYRADVNYAQGPEWTALMYASENGREEVVEFLIVNEAYVDALAEDGGATALMLAVKAGHFGTAALLIDLGADIDAINKHDGSTALIEAVKKANMENVTWLIGKKANVEIFGNDGRTALMHAADNGNASIVKALLDAGADVDALGHGLALMEGEEGLRQAQVRDFAKESATAVDLDAGGRFADEGVTALMYAARKGHTDVVNALLVKGAKVNAITQGVSVGNGDGDDRVNAIQSQNLIPLIGLTALMLASEEGHMKTVRALLDCGANVHAEDEGGTTALIYACCHKETVEALLDGGAEIDAENDEGVTALLCAATEGETETAKLLIDKGANKEAANEDGLTPLMCAARGGQTETALALIAKGAAIEARNTYEDQEGQTPLMYAASEGHTQTAVALICDGGADPFAQLPGDILAMAFHMAVDAGKTETSLVLIRLMTEKAEDLDNFLDFVLGTGPIVAESSSRNETAAAIRNEVARLKEGRLRQSHLPSTVSIEDQPGRASRDVTDNGCSSLSVNIDFRNLHMGRQLGRGSFGEVRLATWNSTEVAVKVLRQANNTPNGALENLRLEGKMLKDLRHPNIVQFFGMTCGPGDWPCIVMEYCSRGSLRRVLDEARNGGEEQRQLTWSRRLKMATDAARGMLCLHQRTLSSAVLHRDLRSPNLLVDKDWKVKVRLCCVVVRAGSFGGGAGAADADLSPTRPQPSLASLNCNARNFFQVADFGLSKRIELARGQASMSTVCRNNPRWLAPEVLRGDQAGPPSDVFSFGVVMWELLTWEHPWSGEHAWNVADKIKNGERLSVPKEDQLPGLDNKDSSRNSVGDYIELMRRCWSQGPENRPKFKCIVKNLRKLSELNHIVDPQLSEPREVETASQGLHRVQAEMGANTLSKRRRQSAELNEMNERAKRDASVCRVVQEARIGSSDDHLKDLDLSDSGTLASEDEDPTVDI